MADLAPRSGSEQTGKRPVIVVSNDGFNSLANWRSIIVIPVSTNRARKGETLVNIAKGVAGLADDSVALCHQITTIDRSKFINYLGELPQNLMMGIETAIKAALDMD
ncbi:MAG: type II toxin-antitoxin system PemK/MazF family toxin [Acidobacteria bacterium]|nr:type II toxin-antitoxin system PemK/MazF family toxin [Acidobacteriota bacterium]